jgi:hypothetical protein
MRIYTEVVWSWNDERGELVRESSKSYDYEGPLSLAQRPNEARTPAATTGANYRDGTADIWQYPAGVGGTNDEYPHYIRFIARRSYTSTNTTRGQINGNVALYMPPDALKTSYTQGIGDVDMGGFIALAGAQGVGGGAGALAGGNFGTAGNEALAAFNKIKGGVTGDGKVDVIKGLMSSMGKAAATGALAKVAGTGAGQAISRATGQILNPHKAVVYQGPGGFRTFSFTFILVPKSADEAKEIFNIVKFFKKRMHPGTSKAGINDVSSVTLTYPDEFEIQYNVNGNPVDGKDVTKPLFKIHNCFMESFAADYTTSGVVSFMDDDQPVTTTISMSFKETQLLTKKDIDAGY